MQRYIFEKEFALADAPGLPVLGLKLLAPALCAYGTPAQQTLYLPKILTGERYWCQGFSESGAGSDLASLRTRAGKDGDHYILSGSKLWTTHAHFTDRMFCLARTDSSVKAQRGISFFLVDMRQPGVRVRPIRTLAGDHEVNEVFLDNIRVPASDLVGAEGKGWSIAKFLLENERGGSCHARRHIHVGRSLFAAELGRLELEAQALEVTELRNLEHVRQGERPGAQSSIVKLVASDLRRHIDALAMNVFGYVGAQLEVKRPMYGPNGPEPLHSKSALVAAPSYLNSQAWAIFGGSNEIQRSIIVKTVLMI